MSRPYRSWAIPSAGMERCDWAEDLPPLYQSYHDEEWGVPSHEDRHLFELLVLEGAQAGLSWSTIRNSWRSVSEIPAQTTESRAMSRDLKRRGFTFVGPTICYAFMQAVGMVN